MKNITLSIPNSLLAAGRRYAKDHHTSLNELIRSLLQKTVLKENSPDSIENTIKLMRETRGNSRGQTWKRDDLYDV